MRKKSFFIQIMILFLFSIQYICAAQKMNVCVIFSDKKDVLSTVWSSCKASLEEQQVLGPITECSLETQKQEEILSTIGNNKFSIVFVLGSGAFDFAQKNIKDTPVVFSGVYLEQVNNLKPNITGVSIKTNERQRIETLLNIFPQFSKIGIFYSDSTLSVLEEIKSVCAEKKVELTARKIENEKDFPVQFADIGPKINLFYITPDKKVYFVQSIKFLLFESLKQSVAVAGLSSFFTKAGAVVSIEPEYKELGIQTARIAVLINNGESPGNIKPETPRKLGYSLNLQVAQRLGIKISEQVISGASEVFGK